MNQIVKVPLERIRDVLYSIDQFKGDALKLPEIKAKGNQLTVTSQAEGGPVFGAGAKSAGSINEAKPKPASN